MLWCGIIRYTPLSCGAPIADDAITLWLGQLQTGDAAAARPLWDKYFHRLVGLARKRLADSPRRTADEEDVALSAFDSFCRGAEAGKFPDLTDRDSLWRLLTTFTVRKVSHHLRDEGRQKRGGASTEGAGELAEIPEFSDSTFHIVTGLLLPVWKAIPDETCKVYRLQTDDGERVIGRLISAAALAMLCRNLGRDQAAAPTPADAWAAVGDGSGSLDLAGGLTVRRVRAMNEYRVEVSGFTAGMRDRLRSMGLYSEIIAWTLRMFIPAGASGPGILEKLMARHPLVAIAGRKAA